MATINRKNNASFLNTARLSYIATAPFNNNFFTYTTLVNAQNVTVGNFTAVTGATTLNCPAGRVLRETGRKLYPSANPSVTTYMVSVYDAQTQLTGFIDPNSQVFAIYNTDKPNFLADGVDPTANVTDAGQSVFTLGSGTFGQFISTGTYLTTNTYAAIGTNMTTGTSISVGTYGSANTFISTGTMFYTGTGLLTAAGQNRVNLNYPYSVASGGTVNIATNISQLFTITLTTSASGTITLNAIDTTASPTSNLSNLVGAIIYLVISNSSGNTQTVVFNSQLRELISGGSPVALTALNNVAYVVTFICNGTSFFEYSRTSVLGS